MHNNDLERMKKSFDLAYFIANEELPLVKYESLVKLETKHGVDLGDSYLNENGKIIKVITLFVGIESLGSGRAFGIVKGPFTKDVRLTLGEGGSAESGCSIVIRVWFYCFIRTQREEGGSKNPGFSQTSFVDGPLVVA